MGRGGDAKANNTLGGEYQKGNPLDRMLEKFKQLCNWNTSAGEGRGAPRCRSHLDKPLPGQMMNVPTLSSIWHSTAPAPLLSCLISGQSCLLCQPGNFASVTCSRTACSPVHVSTAPGAVELPAGDGWPRAHCQPPAGAAPLPSGRLRTWRWEAQKVQSWPLS